MRAVADTSSLIPAAKVPPFWTRFRETFEEVMIPEGVLYEVRRGAEIGSPDVPVIEDAVSQGWVRVATVTTSPKLPDNLGNGEKEAIALMEEVGADWLLVDDRVASTTARLRGLPVRSIAYLLIYWTRRRTLDHGEALILLDELVESGYYLSSKDYLKIKKLIIASGELNNAR